MTSPPPYWLMLFPLVLGALLFLLAEIEQRLRGVDRPFVPHRR